MLLIAALVTLFARASASPPTYGDRAAFQRELNAVIQQLEAGEPQLARRELLRLISQHEGELYVIAELRKLRRVLRAGAFAEQYSEPALGDALRGELLEHDAQRGKVRLQLDFETAAPSATTLHGIDDAPGDLEWSAGRWWYAVPFGGPGTLTLRGRVPELESDEPPTATLYARLSLGDAGGTRTTFEVAVGSRAEDQAPPVRALVERGTEVEAVGEAQESPLVPGAEYELELRVTRRRLFLRSGGETLLSTMRPKETYGRFGWVDLPGLQQLELAGEADVEWLRQLPELHRAKALDAWLDVQELDAGVPSWIVDWTRSNPPLLSDEAAALQRELEELVGAKQYDAARAKLASEEGAVATSWMRAWYGYRIAQGQGRYELALASVERVLELTPRFEMALGSRKKLLSRLGVGKLSEFKGAQSYDEGLEWLAGEEGARVEPFARHWYAFLFHYQLEQLDAAQTELEAALLLRPDYPSGLRWHARLLWRKGLWGSAIESMSRAAVEDLPARLELCQYLLKTGQHERAAAQAAAFGASAEENPEWRELAEALEHAKRAPEFEEPARYEGRDCVVISRLLPAHCRTAVQTFDDTRELVAAFVGEQATAEQVHARIRCYLFHSPEHFELYRREVLELDHEIIWGAHSPAMWQVIVQWRLPTTSLRTTRHEAVHNYLARRFVERPVWLDEGLACYLSCARMEQGEVRFPSDPLDRFSRLRKLARRNYEWRPYAELLVQDHETFYSDSERNYAQSLALVLYLIEGGDEARELWSRLVEQLSAGARSAECAALLMNSMPELDRRVREHLSSLGLR